jgi:hypothetical protein
MHHISRRLSPSLIVAVVALMVALGGTAAAAVIINNPDELGDDVVTLRAMAKDSVDGSTIVDDTVSKNELQHPHLKSQVNSDGSHLGNSDAGLTKRVGEGNYEVTFNRVGGGAQGAKTILSRKCAITATPRNTVNVVVVQGPTTLRPDTVVVRTHSLVNVQGGTLFQANDSAFHIVANC